MATSREESKQLRNNPFFVLNISCSADRRAIVAAADELSFLQDPEQCADAQNALLNPQKRLAAELDWFPDVDEQTLVWIRQSIESGSRIPVGEFGTLARLNAELYNLGFFDLTQQQQFARFERALCSVDRLYTSLNGKDVAEILNQHRKAARMADVSIQEATQELVQKRYRIRKILSECLAKMSDGDCTEKVLQIVQKYIDGKAGDAGVILMDLVSQYELRMQANISALSERIENKINFCKMRTDGVLLDALEELLAIVSEWAALVKPMMICGRAIGMKHEASHKMANELRDLSLFLHNEKDQTAGALKLAEGILGIFADDRMFHNKLSEEVKTLKKMSSQKNTLETLKAELDQLLEMANAAENWSSFGISGRMEELAALVVQLNKKLQELAKEDKDIHKLREMIAMAARAVSVVLHNKHNMTRMAYDFMAFLEILFSDLPDIRSKLRHDKIDLDRQLTLAKQLGLSLRSDTVPFQQMASASSDVWQLNKGKEYHNKKDYKNAMLYYKRAAEMGNADAQNKIGIMYHRGEGVTRNYGEAMVWYRKAAENGCAVAADNIANAYANGWGVAKDEAAMFRWRLKAAEMGYKDAVTKVGYLYYNGIGTEKDYGKARDYFTKGAELGDLAAMTNLAFMYRCGIGMRANKEKALLWYKRAADNKHKDACKQTARMYENGEGTQKDLNKAREYYRLGAELGDKNCIVPAALMYDQNSDEKSKAEAFRLYNQAIDQGVADNQVYRNLGILYMNGRGTGKNYAKAREMFNRAGDSEKLAFLDQKIAEEKEKAGKEKKNRVLRWLTAVAILAVAIIGGCYAMHMQGVNAYKSGDYEKAANYLQIFSVDKTMYADACGKLGEQHLKNKQYDTALSWFSLVSEDVYQDAGRRICEQCFKEKDYDNVLVYADKLSSDQKAKALHAFGDKMMSAGNYEQAAVFFEKAEDTPGTQYYYCMAISELQKGSGASKPKEYIKRAKLFFDSSGTVNNTKKFQQIIKQLDQKKYWEAYDLINDLSAHPPKDVKVADWKKILQNTILEDKQTSIEEFISAQYIIKELDGKTTYDPSRFKTLLDNTKSAMVRLPENDQEVKITDLETIYNICGKEPNGKILIVKECHAYSVGTPSPTYAISFELMQHLPLDYSPRSIEEVAYVVVVSYNYRKDPTGYYFGSTKAIQETAKITVYSLEKGKDIYKSSDIYGAGAPFSFSYKGSPPAYKSGGRPKVGDAFIKALEKIIK